MHLKGCNGSKKWGGSFEDKVYTGIGALYPRSHDPVNKGRGSSIVLALQKQIEKRQIPVRLKGDVAGIQVKEGDQIKHIKTLRGIVLASGGFGADVEMRSKYAPQYDKSLPTTNLPTATGEALNYAQDIGADVIGMDYIQLLVSCNYYTKKYGDLANLGVDHVVFLNLEGERFVAEDARRDVLAAGALAQTEKVFMWIADDRAGKRYSPERTQTALDKGLCFTAPTLEDLARILQEKFNIPQEKLLASIKHYNEMVASGKDTDFGKQAANLKPLEQGPFWASPAQAGVHHTMGGLRTRGVSGQVLDRYGNIIPRFYAAGEATGGLHGTNRLGGNATADCIVFGRLAGKNVAGETPKG